MSDYAALAAIVWPDDGYSTRLYDPDDPHGYKAKVRSLTRFRVTPWPQIELFPRIARMERFVAGWRSRLCEARAALRGETQDRW